MAKSMNPAFPRTLTGGQRLHNNLFSIEFPALKKRRMSRAFAGNVNSFNSVSNNFIIAAADDESQIMAWLSPLELQVRHQDIGSQRVDGIGSWLLETSEFINWFKGSSHAALFCYGDPGVGKSYIWYE